MTLVVGNATDPEGDPLTYGFRVYSDPDLTNLVASTSGVAPGATTTSWEVDAPPGDRHLLLARLRRGCAAPRPVWTDLELLLPQPERRDRSAAGRVDGRPRDAESRDRRDSHPLHGPGDVHEPPRPSTIRRDGWCAISTTVPSATGWHEVVWDGLDDAGRRVPSGSYWVRLWTPGEERTVRVVRVE